MLFTSHTSMTGPFDNANIEVMSFKDNRRKTLQRGGTCGRYVPSGHLVYVNKGTLFAVPFDVDKLEVLGTPFPVLNDVATDNGGAAHFDFSQAGTLIYRSGLARSGLVTLQWLDSGGKTQPLPAKPGYLQTAAPLARWQASCFDDRPPGMTRTSGPTIGSGMRCRA